MFGKKFHVISPESRKRLLIAESDINRAQMVQEWQTIVNGVHSPAAQAKSISSSASAGALLVAAVTAFRHSKAKPASVTPSWFQTVLKGAKLAGSIWLAFRAPPR